MATLTIKNVPDELYEQLKKSAAQNRRSMNSEAIVCLEKALGGKRLDTREFLASVREFRNSLNVFVTDDDLNAAKNEGRP